MSKLLPLSQTELTHFANEGYVVARGLLDVELDIAPVVAEYEAHLDEVLVDWQAEGLIEDVWQKRPFSTRITNIVSQTNLDYSQPLDIALPLSNIQENTPMHTGPAIFDLLRSPRLLNAVEQFIGPEIFSNPVQHVRIKPPESAIPESRIPGEPLPLPMQPGDVLFMTSTTMHTSLRNKSDSIRWSFDLRYNPIGEKTGRPWFPGFVARSQQNPATVLHDWQVWQKSWHDARYALSQQENPTFTRWSKDAVGCA